MTRKEAIKCSKMHWEAIVGWVKKQNPNMPVSSVEMFGAIQQDWYAGSCMLCKWRDLTQRRYKCPLIGEVCTTGCHSAWRELNHTKTWEVFLFFAEQLLQAIRKLK